MTNPKLTQPIKRHGGKHYLAKWILDHTPAHVHYAEPFFGGGSVLLQKDPSGVSEVVNDLDSELSNFWRVLQDGDQFQEFKRRIEATPFSQVAFEESQEAVAGSLVDRAVAFFIVARQSRQGLCNDFATMSRTRTRRGMNEQVSSWLTAIEGLPAVHQRLKRVVIFHTEAVKFIRQQDGADTWFYCDPPYLPSTRSAPDAYRHEMSVEDHRELLEKLSRITGKFTLSGYPNDLYDSFAIEHGWRKVTRKIDNKSSRKSVKDIKTEVLWMNYGHCSGSAELT
jgi:DNA adenine methylase